MTDVIRIGLIGCGNIAGSYLKTLKGVAGLEMAGVVDLNTERAASFAAEHGIPFVERQEDLLADPSIDLILNLTIHHAHFDVTKAALETGKHVFSEKPLAIDPAEAHELVRIAEKHGVRLGCAPVTFLGEAQQTLARQVQDGSLGDVRVVYAEVNHGRIESWHPAPAPFYDVGPIWDVAPYPVTLITSILGPVRSVSAWGTIVHPDRVTQSGESFTLTTPDFVVAMLELESGATVRLTANFFVAGMTPSQQHVEFHGLNGSCLIESWFHFSSRVRAGAFGEHMQDVPSEYPEPYDGSVEWSRGLQDMADAIRNNRPHRCSGAHAAHVTDVLHAINRSVEEDGAPQMIGSGFSLPLPWEPLS